jgi:hypothetical protein
MSTLTDAELRRQRILDKLNKKYKDNPDEGTDSKETSTPASIIPAEKEKISSPQEDKTNLGARNTVPVENRENKTSVFDEYRKIQETEKFDVF